MNSLFTTLLSFAFFYASTTNAQCLPDDSAGPVAVCQALSGDGVCCDCAPQGQDSALCQGESCEEVPCPTTTEAPATTLGVTATGEPCICATVLCPGSGSGSDSDSDSDSGSDSGYPCGSGSGSESDDSSEGSSDSIDFYVNGTGNATEECICTTAAAGGSSSDSGSVSGAGAGAGAGGSASGRYGIGIGIGVGVGSASGRYRIRRSGSSEFAALFNGDETVEDGAETETATGAETEAVDLEINLSEDTLYHVWGMAALVIVANVVLCFVCYKRKNRAKVVVGDDDDSKLNVMA